jgi:hypothetical protein
MLSKMPWLSPPMVQKSELQARVSNSSVLPDLGAARMITGRSKG